VRGSALKAGECACGSGSVSTVGNIWKLLDAVDSYIPEPARDMTSRSYCRLKMYSASLVVVRS